MARYDLISPGSFSDPNNWLNEGTGKSNNGAPGLNDTAIINNPNSDQASGSGNIDTLESDVAFIMNGLALTVNNVTSTANSIGITLNGNSSLTVNSPDGPLDGFIDVSSGLLTTNAEFQMFSMHTGGVEIDPGGTWVANAQVDDAPINTSGDLMAGTLNLVYHLDVGGGTVNAGTTSVDQEMNIQDAQVTLGAVTMFGGVTNGVPQIIISNASTVTVDSITLKSMQSNVNTNDIIEVFGTGTTLTVKGDVTNFPELDAEVSSSTTVVGNLDVNYLTVTGADKSGTLTRVHVQGNLTIGQGSDTPTTTRSAVVADGSLAVDGTLTLGSEAGWNNILTVNQDTSLVQASTSVPGEINATTINIGGAGSGTLAIATGMVTALGVNIGGAAKAELDITSNTATLSASNETFANGVGTIDNGGLLSATGTVRLTSLSALQLQGGTVSASSLSIDSSSTLTGSGLVMGGDVNAGQIIANNGTLTLGQQVGGNGSLTIDSFSTLIASGGWSSLTTVDFTLGGFGEYLAVPVSQPSNGLVSGFMSADTIDIQGVSISSLVYTPSTGVLTYTGSLGQSGTLAFDRANLQSNPQFQHNPSSDGTAITVVSGVSCFAQGTGIQTIDGLVAVEALTLGDRVITRDASAKPIAWIGHRAVNCRAHPKPETVWPVRVAAGAFGENVPARDLFLSPDHAIYVNDVLIPVKLLINGTSIVQVKRDRVTYYHVELPEHAVILADGLTVESYLDTGDRTNFSGSETIRLFPDFTARFAPDTAALWETNGAAPLVMAGPKLAAARQALMESASQRRSRSAKLASQVG